LRAPSREAIPFFFCSSSFLPLHTRAQVAVAHIGEAEHFNPSHPLEGVARGAPTVRTLQMLSAMQARPACTACLLSFQSNPFLSLVPPFSSLSCFLFSLSTLFFPLFPSFFFSVFSVCFIFSLLKSFNPFLSLFPSFFFSVFSVCFLSVFQLLFLSCLFSLFSFQSFNPFLSLVLSFKSFFSVFHNRSSRHI